MQSSRLYTVEGNYNDVYACIRILCKWNLQSGCRPDYINFRAKWDCHKASFASGRASVVWADVLRGLFYPLYPRGY